MADENGQGAAQEEQPETKEPQGGQEAPQGVDWKKEARKWERLSKENLEKAKKLDELEEANKSALEKAQARAEKAEAELAEAKKAAAHAAMVARIAADTGVPERLLHGETEDELEACAKQINDFIQSKAPGYPADKGGGSTPPPATKDSINAIKDPMERLAARAANSSLYR